MEMEMDVTPQQDTCICECRCNYSVHVLSRITDHHYYEVFSHAYLHVQYAHVHYCIPHMYVYTKHYRRWAQKSIELLPTTDRASRVLWSMKYCTSNLPLSSLIPSLGTDFLGMN